MGVLRSASLGLAGLLLGCAAAGACRADEPGYPRVPASAAFWDAWRDGAAEIATYRVTQPRYGEARDAVAVLIYVLEEHDDRTWIKDDRGAVPPEHKAVVLKLNHTLRFQTGVYPYAVMTSVFAPVGGIGRERFAPVRIVFSAQEWCGQVWHRLLPTADGFAEELRSYFSAEGETDRRVPTAPHALYEDALFIQLREPDGPFASGGDWEGEVVPSLWRRRTTHAPLLPRPATITRRDAVLADGTAVTRFVLEYDSKRRVWDVEKAPPRRILAWSSDADGGAPGESATLVGFARLPYWQLNREGDEAQRARVGLRPEVPELLDAPSTPRIGE